jgi:hypothetical protein
MVTGDNDTAYGEDQDREPPQTAPPTSMDDEWQKAADLNPDDFEESEDAGSASEPRR